MFIFGQNIRRFDILVPVPVPVTVPTKLKTNVAVPHDFEDEIKNSFGSSSFYGSGSGSC